MNNIIWPYNLFLELPGAQTNFPVSRCPRWIRLSIALIRFELSKNEMSVFRFAFILLGHCMHWCFWIYFSIKQSLNVWRTT